MPRTARASVGGICYHAINRGNHRARVFHDAHDYHQFLQLIEQAKARLPMRLLGYCLMPNHFHLVLWPHADGDLSRWMHRLLTTHTKRHHWRHETSGRIWQGRFKAFPIQADEHLITVLRYVDRNPLRAKLVERAADWPWSSASGRTDCDQPPVCLPTDWAAFVDQPLTDAEHEALRECVNRERPYGLAQWQVQVAQILGLESSLRPRGRPRK